jgi:hypothetical protein
MEMNPSIEPPYLTGRSSPTIEAQFPIIYPDLACFSVAESGKFFNTVTNGENALARFGGRFLQGLSSHLGSSQWRGEIKRSEGSS